MVACRKHQSRCFRSGKTLGDDDPGSTPIGRLTQYPIGGKVGAHFFLLEKYHSP